VRVLPGGGGELCERLEAPPLARGRFELRLLLRRANTGLAWEVRRLEARAFNLEDPAERAAFVKGEAREVVVPGSGRRVAYDPLKRIGIGLTRLGTSRATALGAYAFALSALDAGR